jgi:hypothetical protein
VPLFVVFLLQDIELTYGYRFHVQKEAYLPTPIMNIYDIALMRSSFYSSLLSYHDKGLREKIVEPLQDSLVMFTAYWTSVLNSS